MDKFDAILPILLILITLLNTIIGVVKGKKKKEQEQAMEMAERAEPAAPEPTPLRRDSLRPERTMRSSLSKPTAPGRQKEPQKPMRESEKKQPENTQAECPPMRRMMQSREEVRKAFVLAEILNRKYL